jgi:hypothetical protein
MLLANPPPRRKETIDARGGATYSRRPEMALPLVRLWIWISAFASLAGWTLAATGHLNRAGYFVSFFAAAVFVFIFRKSLGFAPAKNHSPAKKFFRRFRRFLPLCFAALTILIFLGGVIHAPANFTGLDYRVARVLQWLAHGHWFWINTNNCRMNDRACGIEWLSAPILLFTHSTRPLFLLNFFPFLLLPGLIFNLLTQLGVRARVAWQWMWLLPAGYNFILQAGGIANDTFPTIYALAAMAFGFRAWQTRRVPDLWHSILAAALLTGAKASNLPLLLPWAILIFPLVPLLRRKFFLTTLVLLLAAAISFLPTAILNVHYLGDWSGLSTELPGMNMKNPAVGIWGNTFLLLLANFTPPLFPFAGWWNAHALAMLPHFISAPMSANFEDGFLWLGELPTEDWAGIGFGVSVLVAVAVVANFKRQKISAPPNCIVPVEYRRLVFVAPWIALLAYVMKSGMVTPARLISPYYPLLLPLLLAAPAQSQIIRRRWWRVLTGGALALAFVVLILTPDRPLWPAQTILSRLHSRFPGQGQISRALEVYRVYSIRSDPLAGVRALLPPGVAVVGFFGAADDCDISLWLPLGSRRVEHFLAGDPPEKIRQQVEYAVVGGLNLNLRGVTLADWLQKSGAELVATTNAIQKVTEGPQAWYLVRFKP